MCFPNPSDSEVPRVPSYFYSISVHFCCLQPGVPLHTEKEGHLFRTCCQARIRVSSWSRPCSAKNFRGKPEPRLTPLCASTLSTDTPGHRPWPPALPLEEVSGGPLWSQVQVPTEGGAYDKKCLTSREAAVAHSHRQTERTQKKSIDLAMVFPAELQAEATSPHNSLKSLMFTLSSRFPPFYLIPAHSAEGKTGLRGPRHFPKVPRSPGQVS